MPYAYIISHFTNTIYTATFSFLLHYTLFYIIRTLKQRLMELHLFRLITFLYLVVVGSHAALLSPEDYWKSVLPNTLMPKSLMDLLPSGIITTSLKPQRITSEGDIQSDNNYLAVPDARVPISNNSNNTQINNSASSGQVQNNPKVALFFLEKDMQQGGKLNFNFIKSASKPSIFLSRNTAETIPFSSALAPEILTRFSVKPDSVEAKFMKETIRECERKGMNGEEKFCSTSLESMIDFSVSKIGKNVRVISSEVEKGENGVEGYSIKGVKRIARDKAVVCHKQYYPYAVFYCHKTSKVDSYKVSLIEDDGSKAEAVAVCHRDTLAWAAKHTAFKLLKVKPGSAPVCHFLLQDTVVWVPY